MSIDGIRPIQSHFSLVEGQIGRLCNIASDERIPRRHSMVHGGLCCSGDGDVFGFVKTDALVEIGRISAATSSDGRGTSGAL